MKDVYLVKSGDFVRNFLSEADMQAAGFLKADKIVDEYEFNSNGCYARIIGGEIVVGQTPEEIAEQEKQEQISAYEDQLAQIDQDAMAGRASRDLLLVIADHLGIKGKAVDTLRSYEIKAEPIRVELAPLLKSREG